MARRRRIRRNPGGLGFLPLIAAAVTAAGSAYAASKEAKGAKSSAQAQADAANAAARLALRQAKVEAQGKQKLLLYGAGAAAGLLVLWLVMRKRGRR